MVDQNCRLYFLTASHHSGALTLKGPFGFSVTVGNAKDHCFHQCLFEGARDFRRRKDIRSGFGKTPGRFVQLQQGLVVTSVPKVPI